MHAIHAFFLAHIFLGYALMTLGVLIAGAVAWGLLMIYARGMSDVPLEDEAMRHPDEEKEGPSQ